MAAQQGCRLDRQAPESSVDEQPGESRQHGPVRGLERWPMNLAAEDRDFGSRHDDIDGEVNVALPDEADQLEVAAGRPLEEREGHRRMLVVGARRRQSPGRSRSMTFSAPTSRPCASLASGAP